MNNETILIGLAVLAAVVGYALWQQRKPPRPAAHTLTLTTDLTERARKKTLDPVIGMDAVVERLMHIIARKQKNNPLLIGEPGVGKTAAVERLAQRIADGDVPASFKEKVVLQLHVSDLLLETKYRGEMESKLTALVDRLEAEPRKYILFIDELHMIEQARGGEGSVDIADILKPALGHGLQVIGATTWQEYQKYLKPDSAVERRFQPILVEEPSRDTAVEILRGVKASYEAFHGVCIPDDTVVAAVDTSLRLIKDRMLPDKALDVIDEACAKVSIEGPHPHACALGLVHAASGAVKANCPDGTPTVTTSDIEDIAHQWNKHQAPSAPKAA